MKGLLNKAGKLVKFQDGEFVEATEYDPFLVPDQIESMEQIQRSFSLGNEEAVQSLADFKLVKLDAEIEKPKTKYTVAKVQ